MAILVTCHCGRRFRAKESDAGKRAKCPACGAYFGIPQDASESVASASVYGLIKPKYCLTVLKGRDLLYEHFRLRRSRVTTIGKSSDNAVVLPCPRVSRHHCEISCSAKGWLLKDLQSTNGTYVNGRKIGSTTILHSGQRIGLGDFELLFETPSAGAVEAARLDEQLEALQCGDSQSSQKAVEFLASCGSRAASHLVPRLSGFDTVSGHLAWEVLDKLGPHAVPALIQGLKDKDKLTRSSAARAIGKLGPKAASAVPDLLEALDDQDPTVHADVARALGEIGSAAVPGLVNVLHSTQRARQISAAWTLERIGPQAAEAVPTLSELACQRDQEISQMALAALRKIDSSQTNP